MPYQLAYRKGGGTSDGILAIRCIQTISRNTRQNVYLLISDMSSGFDTVIREWAFKTIKHRLPQNADTTNFDILESIYRQTSGFLTNEKEEIPIKRERVREA